MKKISLILTLVITVMLSSFIIGCGEDEDDESGLYKELTGTYNLYKAEITYVGQPKLVLEPPDVIGSMTISSDQRITQKLQVLGISISVSGTFEIRPDERIMLIDNESVDLISKANYTWDGEVLTTTLDAGTYVEKDFWRKL